MQIVENLNSVIVMARVLTRRCIGPRSCCRCARSHFVQKFDNVFISGETYQQH